LESACSEKSSTVNARQQQLPVTASRIGGTASTFNSTENKRTFCTSDTHFSRIAHILKKKKISHRQLGPLGGSSSPFQHFEPARVKPS